MLFKPEQPLLLCLSSYHISHECVVWAVRPSKTTSPMHKNGIVLYVCQQNRLKCSLIWSYQFYSMESEWIKLHRSSKLWTIIDVILSKTDADTAVLVGACAAAAAVHCPPENAWIKRESGSGGWRFLLGPLFPAALVSWPLPVVVLASSVSGSDLYFQLQKALRHNL